MEYVYAELIRNGSRTIDSIPKSKITKTAVLLIISGDLAYSEVPSAYKAATKAALKAQGYDENGQPLAEEVTE